MTHLVLKGPSDRRRARPKERANGNDGFGKYGVISFGQVLTEGGVLASEFRIIVK
jgi:hypothetical protein